MKEIQFSVTYLHPLFERLPRDKVRTMFIETLEKGLNSSFNNKEKEEASVLLECLFVVISKDIKRTQNFSVTFKDIIASALRDIEPIFEFWKGAISKFKRRFSHYNERFLSEKEKQSITRMLERMQNSPSLFDNLLEKLCLEMSQVEYSAPPYDEPPIPVPIGFLPTSERRTFFESVVPLDTKWRTSS